MTGYRSAFLRHNCNAAGCFIDGLPCWDELIEQFPRKIRPTDVDGFIEINGRFLFMEQKGRGVPFGNEAGQYHALKLLARLPGVTVLFLREGQTTDYESLVLDGGSDPRRAECSRHQLYAWLRKWVRDAEETEGAA